MEVQTALLLHEGATSGSPPPPLVDTPTGTMEEEVEQESKFVPSSPVYSVKSAPGRRSIVSRSLLLRRSPKQHESEKSVHSDGGYRRNRRKIEKKRDAGYGTAYVALSDAEESDSVEKEEESFHSRDSTGKAVKHQSTRSVYSDGDRNRRSRRAADASSSESSVALSLPGRFSRSKSAGTLQTIMDLQESQLLNPSSDDDDEGESFYSAGAFPASPLSTNDTRAEVERLVHRIMPEEDENVEDMMNRFIGRETVLLQTLFILHGQQHAISKSPPRQHGETSNASTPSGLVAREKLARRLTRAGSNRGIRSSKPRSLGSLLRQHSDPQVQNPSSSSRKEDVVGSLQRSRSLRSMNSSASFATPRGSVHSKGTSKSCCSMGAESLVVNPGSIGSTMRRYWDSTGGFIEPTNTKNKTSAAASHRTDPGHHGDGTNNVNVLVGSKSVSGIRSNETSKQERQLAIEFALETGDWEKVEQVGAEVSDNSVSTISTDADLLLGMDGEVELQFVDGFEEDTEFARGSPSTLSIDAREMLAQNIEDCASQLDAVIEEDDWSAVMEIINKYTGNRGKLQALNCQTPNGSSGASSDSIGKRESDKDSSRKAVEESIETESRETSLLTEEATGQEVEIGVSDTLDLSVQRADDQGCRERRELASNGGSIQSSCCSCEKNDSHKHSGHSKDTLEINKDPNKKKAIEESVEIYVTKEAQQEDEKNTITGMSFDVQPKEDLSLLSMNSAGKSNYSNPQSELIGKLKKAIKAGDWNEVQILAQSLDTGDIDGIAAIRDFKTLKNDASAAQPETEPEQSVQDDEEVQLARSSSSHRSENQDHESTSVGISREEESVVTTKWPHESQDRVVDDEEGMEAVLPVEALARPAPPPPPPSNETSQECVCCVVS